MRQGRASRTAEHNALFRALESRLPERRRLFEDRSRRLFASLEKVGESLSFGIDPAALPAFLAERGLTLEWDLGAAQYRERYFREAARRMRGHEFYRVALARVPEPAARTR